MWINHMDGGQIHLEFDIMKIFFKRKKEKKHTCKRQLVKNFGSTAPKVILTSKMPKKKRGLRDHMERLRCEETKQNSLSH